MRQFFVFLWALSLFISCSYSPGKKNAYNAPARKHINVVGNVDGHNVAYTEEGHTLIYEKDSIGNFNLLYVKFENGAGKYGLRGIKEKIIRVEIDSTFTTLNSFMSVFGGAFCKAAGNQRCFVSYFDEQLNGNDYLQIDIPIVMEQLAIVTEEDKVKRFTEFLDVANSIAHVINDKNVSGWSNIVYALESTCSLQSYDVIICSSIYDEKVKKRVSRIWEMNEKLKSLNHFLRENMTNECKQPIAYD